MGLNRAHPKTVPAADTFTCLKRNMNVSTNPFGVVTPKASQRTPLEKNGRTDSGTIVDTESLNIEYPPFYFFVIFVLHLQHPSLLNMYKRYE